MIMNAEKQEIKVRRVPTRKRTRDSFRSPLTPATKRGSTSLRQCPDSTENRVISTAMADVKATEVCYVVTIDWLTLT